MLDIPPEAVEAIVKDRYESHRRASAGSVHVGDFLGAWEERSGDARESYLCTARRILVEAGPALSAIRHQRDEELRKRLNSAAVIEVLVNELGIARWGKGWRTYELDCEVREPIARTNAARIPDRLAKAIFEEDDDA